VGKVGVVGKIGTGKVGAVVGGVGDFAVGEVGAVVGAVGDFAVGEVGGVFVVSDVDVCVLLISRYPMSFMNFRFIFFLNLEDLVFFSIDLCLFIKMFLGNSKLCDLVYKFLRTVMGETAGELDGDICGDIAGEMEGEIPQFS